MIVTCKKEVPFRWIAVGVTPWIAYNFNYGVMGAAFIFSLKKFVENPASLTFIISLPGFLSIALAPIVNFSSDRIWTRFGRRKPFLVTAWVGMALGFVLMPLMPTFWGLLGVFIFYNLCNDIGGPTGPMEPLNQEIVPPHQRGRAMGILQWCGNLVTMLFYYLALGRFDDVRFMAGVPLNGEKVIFWTAGLLIVAVLIFVSLGIKEVNQKSPLRGQRLNLKNFFGGILDRQLWPVYTLSFAGQMLGAGLGALGNLLYTDQWNYSKQEMGLNVVIGGVINMFVIAYLAVIADRLNRMKAYQVLICIALALKVSYYCYVTFVLPDQRPSLVELVVFGEMLSIVGILTGMVATPLVYDYVTRNKLGTYLAGGGLLGRITTLVTLNGAGLFIWGYAALFQPPGRRHGARGFAPRDGQAGGAGRDPRRRVDLPAGRRPGGTGGRASQRLVRHGYGARPGPLLGSAVARLEQRTTGRRTGESQQGKLPAFSPGKAAARRRGRIESGRQAGSRRAQATAGG